MEAARYPASEFGRARRTGGRHSYVAYFPAPIPRSLELPNATVRLLADAEGSLGQLAGVGRLLPNPELLIRPYLLREALSSTRIEGTQASLAEVLEADATGGAPNADVEEVVNYMERCGGASGDSTGLPMSTRLFGEMHRRLMAGVRGRERAPGELRRTQNWIGAPGSTVEDGRLRSAATIRARRSARGLGEVRPRGSPKCRSWSRTPCFTRSSRRSIRSSTATAVLGGS